MPAVTSLRSVAATRYVTPFREGGSMPGLVEADDDGLYVVKFSGAGQGTLALIAEIVCAELAHAIDLPMPELILVEIDPALGAAEPDPEIQELIEASPGANLGIDFLPGAVTYTPAAKFVPTSALAAAIVWFDALVTNVDRTARNPNLLVWHHQLWLIDHGAAIYMQHAGLRAEHAARPFEQIADHVLLPCAGSIVEAHERLAPRLSRAAIEHAIAQVPQQWWTITPPDVYVDYLEARLGDGGFAKEAEHVRGA